MKIGDKIITVERCLSTNDLAREAAVHGVEEGTVFVAGEQTKGKGTRGRSWYSARDKGLYASIILRPKKHPLSLLPLVAGLAVKDAVASALHVQVKLRWPNDILWGGEKVGGILSESGFIGDELRYVIVGIGLNLYHTEEDFPVEIRNIATSLKIITGKAFDKKILCKSLWRALDHWYLLYCSGEGERITEAFERSSVFFRGDKVTLFTDEGEIEAVYRGIDSRGGIIVERDRNRQSYLTAEVKKTKEEERRK